MTPGNISAVVREGSMQGWVPGDHSRGRGEITRVANKPKVSTALDSLGGLRRKGLGQELKRND